MKELNGIMNCIGVTHWFWESRVRGAIATRKKVRNSYCRRMCFRLWTYALTDSFSTFQEWLGNPKIINKLKTTTNTIYSSNPNLKHLHHTTTSEFDNCKYRRIKRNLVTFQVTLGVLFVMRLGLPSPSHVRYSKRLSFFSIIEYDAK